MSLHTISVLDDHRLERLRQMRKEIAAGFILVAFIIGFWIGRRFPTHHYERLTDGVPNAEFRVDTSTGKLCSVLKPFSDKAEEYTHKQSVDPASPFFYVPACGN